MNRRYGRAAMDLISKMKMKERSVNVDKFIKEEIISIHSVSDVDGDDDDHSSDDVDSESDDANEASTDEILQGVVSSPSSFKKVEGPGSLTLTDMAEEDNEYFIFKFPPGFLNPSSLVGNKIKVKNSSSQILSLGRNSYELSIHQDSSLHDTPAFFLPDNTGQLSQADLKISGHITMKKIPLACAGAQQIDIDDLRSRSHRPPEIRQRSFFGDPGTPTSHADYSKGPKHSKEKTPKSKKRKSMMESELIVPAVYEKDILRSPFKKADRKLGKLKKEIGTESPFKAASPYLQKGHSFSNLSDGENELAMEIKIKKEVMTPKKKRKSKSFEEFSPLGISPNMKIKKEKEF